MIDPSNAMGHSARFTIVHTLHSGGESRQFRKGQGRDVVGNTWEKV